MKQLRKRMLFTGLVIVLCMLCAAAFADVSINETNFPDKNFREYVKKSFDQDRNGLLSEDEISAATFISCYNKGISSLQGIEFFTCAKKLMCCDNKITELDLSQNTKLEEITCYSNLLKEINVSRNTELVFLSCYKNELGSLDITANTKLETLYCENNKMTALDVSHCPTLCGYMAQYERETIDSGYDKYGPHFTFDSNVTITGHDFVSPPLPIPGPTSISFEDQEIWIAAGDRKEYTIHVEPEDDESRYDFSLPDQPYVEIYYMWSSGRDVCLDGLQPGETILSVDTANGLHAECKVHVTAPVTSISFTEEYVTIYEGETHQLNVIAKTEDGKEYSNELVSFSARLGITYVDVDRHGLITGRSARAESVSAKACGVNAVCHVLVFPTSGNRVICVGQTVTETNYMGYPPGLNAEVSNPEAVRVDSVEEAPDSVYSYIITYTGISVGKTQIELHDRIGAGFDNYFFVAVEEHDVAIIPQIDPTYDNPGWTEGRYCRRCHATLQEQEEIPQLVRPDNATVNGGKYRLDHEAGTAVFTGPEKATAGSVNVPDTIKAYAKKYKVVAIENNACKGLTKLKTATIGKSVKTIGKNAFAGCTKLASITGGTAVVNIGDSAFSGCKALKTFPVMSKLQSIGANAFKGCVKLAKFTLAAKVKSIGKNAFNGCKGLKIIDVKTTKLTDKNVGAAAFKGIFKKAVFKCPKKKLKAYKELFIKKGAPKTCIFEY